MITNVQNFLNQMLADGRYKKIFYVNWQPTTCQFCQRWHHESNPPLLWRFGATDRPSRRHKMTVQRFTPSLPPVNSAEVLQFMR